MRLRVGKDTRVNMSMWADQRQIGNCVIKLHCHPFLRGVGVKVAVAGQPQGSGDMCPTLFLLDSHGLTFLGCCLDCSVLIAVLSAMRHEVRQLGYYSSFALATAIMAIGACSDSDL